MPGIWNYGDLLQEGVPIWNSSCSQIRHLTKFMLIKWHFQESPVCTGQSSEMVMLGIMPPVLFFFSVFGGNSPRDAAFGLSFW